MNVSGDALRDKPNTMAATTTHNLSLHRRQSSVISRPFAGRLGGNQEFAVEPGDPGYEEITAKAPDASTHLKWSRSLDLRGLSDIELWKQACIEGTGASFLTFLTGCFALGLAPYATTTSLGPVTPAIIGGIANAIILPLFIFAGGPVSGGHFNPFITISTFFARLSTLPRTVAYVLLQCTGSVIGGFMLRAATALKPKDLAIIPGCYADPAQISSAQVYAFEVMTGCALIFLSFGVGLDPRQRGVFGPALAPILVGVILGICTFATSFIRPGYTGATLNPARCLGLMAAGQRFDYHWVQWLGDITAAALHGLLYWAIPPYKY